MSYTARWLGSRCTAVSWHVKRLFNSFQKNNNKKTNGETWIQVKGGPQARTQVGRNENVEYVQNIFIRQDSCGWSINIYSTAVLSSILSCSWRSLVSSLFTTEEQGKVGPWRNVDFLYTPRPGSWRHGPSQNDNAHSRVS